MTAPAVGTPATRSARWTPAAPWGARGWVSDLDGPVHWVEFGEPADGPATPLVFVHGLGGSHLNWVLIGPALATGRRAIAVDLPGFGLSPGEGRDCSVRANARLLLRFLDLVIGQPTTLVGNSMGATVSLLAADARPDAVSGLVLVDPALPLPAQRPDARVAATFALFMAPVAAEMGLKWLTSRRSSRQLVDRVVQTCFAEPSRAPEAVLEASTALVEYRRSMDGGERSRVAAARSLLRLLAQPAAYRTVLRSISVPTLLIHGEADRLVPISAARRAAADRPDWQTRFLPDVGHTPQLEKPEAVVDAVGGWLATHPAPGDR